MVSIRRIGLAVGADAVRGVGLDSSGRVVWAAAAPVASREQLADALTDLLADLPRVWRAPYLTVAVGPAGCQMRRLTGIPGIQDAATASDLVRENIPMFFLRNGVPLDAGTAVRDAAGAWWGAVFEQPIVGAVRIAARQGRMRLRAIVPEIALFAAPEGEASSLWSDGDTHLELCYADGILESVKRTSGGNPARSMPLNEALVGIGGDAAAFVPAWLAATAPLANVPRLESATAPTPVPAWRWVSALGGVLISVVLALAGPGIGSLIAARHFESLAIELEADAAPVLVQRAEARRFAAALAEFRDATRGQPFSAVLAELARALPDSAAFLTLRLDSSGMQAVVLAPRISSLLERLDASPAFAAPRVTGPVVREQAAGRVLERGTIRSGLR